MRGERARTREREGLTDGERKRELREMEPGVDAAAILHPAPSILKLESSTLNPKHTKP
jgi:hypothetical protein